MKVLRFVLDMTGVSGFWYAWVSGDGRVRRRLCAAAGQSVIQPLRLA